MCIFASHQCADYARASYAGAGEARVTRVMLAVGVHTYFVRIDPQFKITSHHIK